MSARITIQSGIAAGTSHRLENRVARVGSDPQSDICLPTAEVPGHALTLEFRDDHCRVYNRCRDNVYIGAQVVGPDQVAEWPETDILQLGEDIELMLDFEDDNENHNVLNGLEYDEPVQSGDEAAQAPTVRSSSSSSAKTLLQLGVTVLCVIGCVLLLIRDKNRTAPKADAPDFAAVVLNGLKNPSVSSELIRRVQHAESQRIRGQEETARRQFVSIRDDLMPHFANNRTERTEELEPIFKLVQSRLAD
jgi:hypothetical protein